MKEIPALQRQLRELPHGRHSGREPEDTPYESRKTRNSHVYDIRCQRKPCLRQHETHEK